jgi:hypothetical protein
MTWENEPTIYGLSEELDPHHIDLDDWSVLKRELEPHPGFVEDMLARRDLTRRIYDPHPYPNELTQSSAQLSHYSPAQPRTSPRRPKPRHTPK